MKVCIIGSRNLNGMTLMSIYTDIFEKYKIEYDIIYMNHLGIKENSKARKLFPFVAKKKDFGNKYLNFIYDQFELRRFRHYAINIIKKYRYDYYVLWIENMGYIFGNYMSKNFKGRYSVNIRDIWNHNYSFIVKPFSKAVENSSVNTVSSPEFIKHLPKADYLFVHSANLQIVNKIVRSTHRKEDRPIVITNVGTFRNDTYCFALVDALANDDRYILKFIGNGSERMSDYCKQNNYSNVFCSGSFSPSETALKFEDADIINCAYGSESKAETAKIPIRLYYAIYRGTPILCTQGTQICVFATKLKAAIVIPEQIEKINLADMIFKQFNEINYDIMISNMDIMKNEIEESHDKLEKKVCEALGITYR